MDHFGIRVLDGERGLYLSRKKYAIINNESSFYGKNSDRKGKL